MSQPISAREAAKLARKSKATINRDATKGQLPVVQQYPGYNGPRLFDPDAVLDYYKPADS